MECEALLLNEIITPYEDGQLTARDLGEDVWVVAHAYLNAGTAELKLGNYDRAQSWVEQARGFDDIPFATGFHFQVKNTLDFVEKKLEGE